jgi:O-antigen ligase
MQSLARRLPVSWASLLFAAFLASALLAPSTLWALLALSVALGCAFLAWQHLTGFCVGWLLLAGLTLEMTLHDLIGPDAYAITIAVVKAAQFALAALAVLRYGPRADPVNPAWAFLLMFGLGLGHGLHPGLTVSASLRSLAGSVAPFVFCFSRLSPGWAEAMIAAPRWVPLLSVAGGGLLDAAGLRPLFVESGGARLAGLGHPAFLAGVTLTAIYACLIRLYRNGRWGDLGLLAANFTVLLLTGARAPLAYGTIVTTLTLAFVAAPAFPARRRWLLLLGGVTLLPVLLAFAGDLAGIRLFNLLRSDSTDLSGRNLLWPAFEHAAAQSPWFGWGVGAGNVIIAPDSKVAQLLETWAAHNEYLRIAVEGGQVGRALLIVSFVLWGWSHTRRLAAPERRIMCLILLAFACHAVTDNVLISTPASVFFTFVAAVFARPALPNTARLA